MPQIHCFTTVFPAIMRVLQTDCVVCAAFGPASVAPTFAPILTPFKAIWDTGATASVITQAVVSACGLKPTGMVMVAGVHGVHPRETFLVNIGLPNRVGFSSLEVTIGEVAGGDVLIGMDIIAAGDLAITNNGGSTMLSYRYPSVGKVDFVNEAQRANQGQIAQPRQGGSNYTPPKKKRKGKSR